jgi:hypothetical protein
MRLGIIGRSGGVRRNWPGLGAVTGLHEEFVEGEFDRWADDVERIRGRERVTDAFAVVHRIREGGIGEEKGRGTKVTRKERGEAEKSIVGTSSGCGNGGGGVRVIAFLVGVVGVIVAW